MDAGARTFLVVGFGVIGIAPVVLLGFYVLELRRRRRAAAGLDVGRRFGPFEIGFIVVALMALTAGSYAYVQSNPELAQEGEDHSQHEEGAEGVPVTGGPAVAGPSTPTDELPATLAGIPRTELAVGPEALEQVGHLHQGAEIDIVSAAVARYAGPTGRAELWMSRSLDPAAASELARDMADRIATSDSPFEPPVSVAGEAMMWETRGMGQVHHFWAAGTGVWWLSIDEGLLPVAMSESKALAETGS